MRTDFYSDDTLTLGTADRTEVERLNDILEKSTLGRPLGAPSRAAGPRLIVPVADDGVTADQVVSALEAAGVDIEVRRDPVALAGTRFLHLAGRDIPHGFEPAEAVASAPEPPPWEPLPANLRRPVVALLDSGVQPHAWFPDDEHDPFLLFSDWESPLDELGSIAQRHGRDIPHGGAEAGHATFIAGIVRAAAPSARVLSVKVMSSDGKVRESIVTSALHWLVRYVDENNPLDVVCMAFGREPGDHGDEQALADLAGPLRLLADRGVALVASAGNDHVDEQIFPAAFPMVTAVGAGFARYHATFSNYGDWVDRYRDGVEVLSTMPDDRWARWSGTSFSAAAYAGDLARPHVV
jgi:subtilisin family serine protease